MKLSKKELIKLSLQVDELNRLANKTGNSFLMNDGRRLINVHPESACAGQYCCIHNPSDHPMKDFPLSWRADRRIMERICPHGVGHPDPDDNAFIRRTRGDKIADGEGIHGCDGCCSHPTEK